MDKGTNINLHHYYFNQYCQLCVIARCEDYERL
jgi:hypothetical protein